jgi:antitoxin component YwqK of YwqJK toxin-antitoxin module
MKSIITLIIFFNTILSSYAQNQDLKIEYYNNGKVKSIGNYKEEKKDGEWKEFFYLTNSQTLDSLVVKEFGYFNLKIATGNYKEGKKEGEWKLFLNGNSSEYVNLIIYNYKNDKKEGDFKMFFGNGELYQSGSFHNDLEVGEWREYYNRTPNYSLKSIRNYNNGILEGEAQDFDFGARKTIFYYKNGKINGEGKGFDSNGNLIKVDYFTNGELNYYKLYDERGKLSEMKTIKDSTETKIVYYPNQQPKEISKTKNSKTTELRIFSENGNLVSIKNFKNDYIPDGEWIEYYENEQIKSLSIYNGEKVVSKKFEINGVLKSVENYYFDLDESISGISDGLTLNGESIQYYPDGKIKKVNNYKNVEPTIDFEDSLIINEKTLGNSNPLNSLKKMEIDFHSDIQLSQVHLAPLKNLRLAQGFYDILSKGGCLSRNDLNVEFKNNKISLVHTFWDGNDIHSVNFKFISYKNGVITTDKALLYLVYTDSVAIWKGQDNEKQKFNGIILRFTNKFNVNCKYPVSKGGVDIIDRINQCEFFAFPSKIMRKVTN